MKAMGVLCGITIALVTFSATAYLTQSNGAPSFVGPMIGLVVGGTGGLVLFVIGVIVSAYGQLIESSLDCAVNTSPFLTNPLRSEIMSLD